MVTDETNGTTNAARKKGLAAAQADGAGANASAPDVRTLRWSNLARPIGIVWRDIEEFRPAPRRIRRATEKQVEAVRRAIERYGFRNPILIDGRGTIIDGHIRFEATRRLGIDRIPCIVVDDLPEVEIRRLALSLNKLQGSVRGTRLEAGQGVR